jgi:hypothetical protein
MTSSWTWVWRPPAKDMTLLDYFAGNALLGLMLASNVNSQIVADAQAAQRAYAIAHAMITERRNRHMAKEVESETVPPELPSAAGDRFVRNEDWFRRCGRLEQELSALWHMYKVAKERLGELEAGSPPKSS